MVTRFSGKYATALDVMLLSQMVLIFACDGLDLKCLKVDYGRTLKQPLAHSLWGMTWVSLKLLHKGFKLQI